MAEQSYHSLHAPHGIMELQVPSDPPALRHFFEQCIASHDFQTATSERAQVHMCFRWGKEHYDGNLSLRNLADFFMIAKSTVSYHLSRPFDIFEGSECGQIGRPPLLSPEDMQILRDYITARHEQHYPCTYDDVPRSRTRWECDVKASGNDRVIWRVPLHRKSNIIEWVLRLDDFLKQTGSKAILSPRRASGRLVLGWLWSSEGKGQDGFDVHQVWPFVTVSSTGPNRLEFVLVFRESVPRGLYA